MHYQGLFWSAIIRALLSFRRDSGLSNERDNLALECIASVESGKLDDETLANLFHDLCPTSQFQQTGRSLIGYLDFNKMSNLVVYLTASKHIDDAMHVLGKHYRHLMGEQANLTETSDGTITTVEFSSSPHMILTELRCYFLLALFRHLAGRKFDFSRVTMPPMNAQPEALLAPLSRSDINYESGKVRLCFANAWCEVASFYYSQSIKKMLSAGLEETHDIPLKQQVRDVFQKAASPARIRSEWVATQLGQTESAFRRQLRQDSISFSALLKEFIHDQSCHRLLSGQKTEDAAEALGFSDRRSFERSFKEHSGISAGQLRQLGNRLRFQTGNSNLLEVVENLPPLPHSIRSLLKMDAEAMTLPGVVSLIEKDPIFQAHVMSKASRAVYGTTPKSLEQAIGRNLGLGNIRDLAVIFAAQQLLTAQCRFSNIEILTDAMLLSYTVFQRLFGFSQYDDAQTEKIKQLLLFGTLSVFLIFHDECLFADGALSGWEESDSFRDFVDKVNQDYGICLYGATSLMLLRWGFASDLNQQLWKLCNIDERGSASSVAGQILLCHDIAFTSLAKLGEPQGYTAGDGLTEAQINTLTDVLAKWKSSAA